MTLRQLIQSAIEDAEALRTTNLLRGRAIVEKLQSADAMIRDWITFDYNDPSTFPRRGGQYLITVCTGTNGMFRAVTIASWQAGPDYWANCSGMCIHAYKEIDAPFEDGRHNP